MRVTGVSILMQYNARYLVGQRTPGPTWPNMLQFPGGRNEDGENVLQTVIREMVEETGLAPDPSRLTPVCSVRARWPHGGMINVEAYHYSLLEPETRLVSNKEPTKNKGWMWMPRAEIRKMRNIFRAPDHNIIKRVF
jgi:8-oxo-dGTP pyrophosphatase MutT (NUDIX family)